MGWRTNIKGPEWFFNCFPTRIRVELCGIHVPGKLSLRRCRLPLPRPDVRAALPWRDCAGSASYFGGVSPTGTARCDAVQNVHSSDSAYRPGLSPHTYRAEYGAWRLGCDGACHTGSHQ